MPEIVLWFDDITKDDVPSAGGKGANLGELTRNGVPVPPGFVVSADAYRDFLDRASIRDSMTRALADADASNVQGLQVVSDEVRSLVESASVPEDIASDVHAAYEKMGGGPVAVRSSATAEDQPSASFAGQQSTYLNVEGPDAVIEALRACWASLFEPHAISYRALNGFDHMETAIAVPVQRMVQSERSGVIFTINPVTGEQGQVVIEAVWGLGEAAVSGQVTPDMYVVDKAAHAVIERAHSLQEHELLRDPDGHTLHANAWRDVPQDRRDAPKLSDADAVALAKLAMRVEILYGRPQDIEWAIEGGEMYILQARPVTAV
jgi:pyruvate,water dikinase